MLDIRFSTRMAVRALRAAPAVSVLAIVCIGLGIGAVTTVYSTASAFTFHPLPQLVDPGRLLFVSDAPASTPEREAGVAPATYADLATLPEFAATAAVRFVTVNLTGVDAPVRATGARATADFFRLAGRFPRLGRGFLPEEMQPGADRVVVLGHGLWRSRFGADSTVVGRTIQLDGEAWTVAGVMPPDFAFPIGAEFWAPLALTPAEAVDRTGRDLFMLARLAPSVSPERAQTAVRALRQRLAADWPGVYDERVFHTQMAEAFFGSGPRPFMVVLLGAVAFLLLIACGNVANLLLVRATGRRRETGVRVALGASRGQLAVQLLIESLLLALAGGAVGVLLAWWGTQAATATVPVDVQRYLPGFGAIRLDGRAFAVATMVSMLSGVLFGLVPATAGTKVDVVTALKDGGTGEPRRLGARRFRVGLVIGEIALALILVAGAGLMVATFRRISLSDPGFRTARVLTAAISLPDVDYDRDSVVVRFWDRLREATAGLPGVESVELTTVLPMTWDDRRASFYPANERPERLEDAPIAGVRQVSPGYLDGLGVALVSGRMLAPTDRQDQPAVAVVSESAARRFFPAGGSVGRQLVRGNRSVEIVGVVRDVRGNPLTADAPLDVVYLPLAQWPSRTAYLVATTRVDPTSVTRGVQAAVGRIDSRLAAGEVATMAAVVATVTSPQAATAKLLTASAMIALVLAAVGTYGVMSHAVARRTRELAIRAALGESRAGVLRLVMAGATGMALAGVGLGLVGALALGRGMDAVLFDTSPTDPWVLGGAATLLAAIALIAGYVPARRAASVNPMVALRND
ncbi:MAG: ABC transporter permease [Gemmatimonadetes bacterium]|nr:ABC transporter permease [Gemmatimonadota bacterium]